MDYGCCVWDSQTKKQKEELEKVQKNAARFITNNYDYTPGSTSMSMQRLGWIPLEEHRARIKSTAFYKGMHILSNIPIDKYQINNNNINTKAKSEIKMIEYQHQT